MYCTAGLDPLVVMPSVAAVLHRLVGALSVAYIEVDEDCLPQRYYAEHFSAESHALFQNVCNTDLLNTVQDPASFARLFSLPCAWGNLIAPPSAFYTSSIYKHFFEPNGIYHVLDMAVKQGSTPKAVIGIFRERGAAAFTDREAGYLSRLYAYFKHLTLQPQADVFGDDGGAIIGSATLVLNERLKVQWMSAGAVHMLAYGLQTGERCALSVHGQLPGAVEQVCRQALQSGQSWGWGDVSPVPYVIQPLPGGGLGVRAHRLYAASAGMPNMLVVSLHWQAHPLFVLMRWCEQARVSERERQLLVQVFSGRTGKEMALTAGIKLSTCKSYLRSAYQKLQVHDRAGFLSALKNSQNGMIEPLHEQMERAFPG